MTNEELASLRGKYGEKGFTLSVPTEVLAEKVTPASLLVGLACCALTTLASILEASGTLGTRPLTLASDARSGNSKSRSTYRSPGR